ncbi:MAG: EAL domain-containing protein [Bacillota bacterium]|nr:EAL domain-containing protein [Bacillota bacterium]
MQLTEKFYYSVIHKSNNGFASFHVILDDNGIPVDLNHIDINSSYEALTGFSKDSIIGKSILHVMRSTGSEDNDWIYQLIDILRSGNPIDIDVYSRITKKWFKAQGYFYAKEQLIINFTEITLLKSKNEDLKILNEKLAASKQELREQYEEYKRAQDAFRKLTERYKLAVEGARDVIWDWDSDVNKIYISDRFYKIIGYTKEEFYNLYENIAEVIHPEDKSDFLGSLTEHFQGKSDLFSAECRVQMKNGDYIWFLSKGRAVFDDKGSVKRITGSSSDITERKNYEEQIRQLAYYDYLTGLPNRAYLIEKLEALLLECESCECYGAVILVDIDNFKLINDTYGHLFGDRMLKIITERLCGIQADNIKINLTKLGGDEFVFIIERPENRTEIEEIALRVLAVFKHPIILEDKLFHITCSMGVTMYPENGTKVYDIIKNADTAMNKAKESGKNCCAFYNQAMGDEIAEKFEMENHMRLAIENNEFKLYYQPQVDIALGKIIGFEALIRWFSPKYGLVSPMSFIPLAEENGLIIEIGNWVIDNVCQFTAKINNEHNKNLHITLNVSAVQFMQLDFVDKIFEAVKKYDVNPHNLGIELTESTLLEFSDIIVSRLNKLREAGFKVYLDDFGTGYSSLNYLRKLPIDIIKIDKSFVGDIENFEIEKKLLRSIVYLAQEIGLKVVAEGVETKAQLDFLARSKCDIIQGFLFSRPVSEEDVVKMLKSLEE